MMRAIATPILMIIMLISLIVVIIPAIILFSTSSSINDQGSSSSNSYRELQQIQVQNVFRGNPNIFYNSTKSSPSLVFQYSSTPLIMNITQIFYSTKSNGWVPILNNSIIIYGNTVLPLGNAVFNKPIIIVTSLGNIFFLNPNTSVTTSQVNSGGMGKIPVYLLSFAYNGSNIIPINVNLSLGGNKYTTPSIVLVNQGSYQLNALNNVVFLPQYGLTAQFQNWSILGYASISSNSISTTLTVQGPTVVTAVYKANLQKYRVYINESGIPLGKAGIPDPGNALSGATITPDNNSIQVIIDGRNYSLTSSGLTLSLTYGYHSVQFPKSLNIVFDYYYKNNIIKYGELINYIFIKFTYNKNITISNSSNSQVVIFINGSTTLTALYNINLLYYLVTFVNNFFLPNGDKLISNSTPILGNIAGTLISINGQEYGPSQNYVPEKAYLLNTTYYVTNIYLNDISGNFSIRINGKVNSFSDLLSWPQGLTINTPFGNYKINVGNYFQVNSPMTVIDNQMWQYGGFILSFISRGFIRRERALSNALAIMLIIIVISVIAIPFVSYLMLIQNSYVPQYVYVNNYVNLKSLQESAVKNGHPAIYYSGYNNSIYFIYSNGTFSPPLNLTISKVLFFNGSTWLDVNFNYPIIINQNYPLKLPSNIAGKPIMIVTTLGNLFFLMPNSTIGPISIPSTKGGVEILTQIYQQTNPTSVNTNITTNIMGSFKNYTTPAVFANMTGTFQLRVPTYVFYTDKTGKIITGVFNNWIVFGNANLNSSNTQAVKVSLNGGSTILIANYTPIVTKVNLIIETNAVNNIYINVDGSLYSINSSTPLNLTVFAGYQNLTALTNTFNDTSKESQGIINEYSFSNWSYNNNYIKQYSTIIFLPPTQKNNYITLYYSLFTSFYQVYIKFNYIGFPPNTQINPDPGSPDSGSVLFVLNNTEYNYNSYYWIQKGVYQWSTVGLFQSDQYYVTSPNYKGYVVGIAANAKDLSLSGAININGQYLTISGPGTITANYWWYLSYLSLTG